jgi:hypothetical protein
MYFTAEQIEDMKTILRRLEPDTITASQFFTPDNEFRTGCPIVINNKFGKPICLFQNYENLSAYRKRLILRLSIQIPFEIHITQPRESITRIGWKYKK